MSESAIEAKPTPPSPRRPKANGFTARNERAPAPVTLPRAPWEEEAAAE